MSDFHCGVSVSVEKICLCPVPPVPGDEPSYNGGDLIRDRAAWRKSIKYLGEVFWPG